MYVTQFPEGAQEYLEPLVLGTVVFPAEYLGKIIKLCEVSFTQKHFSQKSLSKLRNVFGFILYINTLIIGGAGLLPALLIRYLIVI